MTREAIAKVLAEKGFSGKTADEALAFISEKNLQFKSKGQPVTAEQIKAAWDAKVDVELPEDNEADVTPAVKKAPEVKSEPTAEQVLKNARKATVQSAAVHGGDSFSAKRKQYEARIKTFGIGTERNQAKFADGDSAEQFGAYFRLALHKMYPNLLGGYSTTQLANDEAIIGKAQSSIVSNNGAVLIPEEYAAQVIWLTEQYGVARKTANVVRMTKDNLKYPRKTSIPAMVATSSGAQGTQGTMTFDLVNLNAQKFMLLIQSPNELIEDAAVSVADQVASSFAESQAITEDQCYFIGDGTSTYGGIQGLASALPAGAYQNGAGNSWSALTEANVEAVFASLQNVDPRRVEMRCSRQFYYSVLRPIIMGKGGVTAVEATNGVTLPGGVDFLWKGTPGRFSQVLPTSSASASKVLYIGDFVGASMLGVRNDLAIDVSDQLKFDYDSIVWRGRARFDVNIHGDGRGSTVGPIACLQTT